MWDDFEEGVHGTRMIWEGRGPVMPEGLKNTVLGCLDNLERVKRMADLIQTSFICA